MTDLPRPICIRCEKYADELPEYIGAAKAEKCTVPDPTDEQLDAIVVTADEVNDYVRSGEGTYNHENGHFLCTPCYIKAGMPSSPRGWRAP
jgi:hypothetical protein